MMLCLLPDFALWMKMCDNLTRGAGTLRRNQTPKTPQRVRMAQQHHQQKPKMTQMQSSISIISRPCFSWTWTRGNQSRI
jgi:hypothetical protein